MQQYSAYCTSTLQTGKLHHGGGQTEAIDVRNRAYTVFEVKGDSVNSQWKRKRGHSRAFLLLKHQTTATVLSMLTLVLYYNYMYYYTRTLTISRAISLHNLKSQKAQVIRISIRNNIT